MKKAIALILAICMCTVLAGCTKEDESQESKKEKNTTQAVETETVNNNAINPLTGVKDLDPNMVGKRPTAVMVNNIKIAQGVQTGAGEADMVFETLVEGGITRLLAVFSDIKKVSQLGTVRSARYTYAELAAGLDAHYVHCGKDEVYCGPLLTSIGLDSLDLGNNASSAGSRVSNGLSSEHTLYTYGDKLSSVEKSKRTDIKSDKKNLYKFAPEDEPQSFENPATKVRAYFSGSYSTGFEYDSALKKYARINSSGTAFVDYKTGEKEYFTNVFVLNTDVYNLSDNYHVRSQLDSGSGIYASGGTMTKIKWSKGSATSPLKFTLEDGTPLTINAGNSYICITEEGYKAE